MKIKYVCTLDVGEGKGAAVVEMKQFLRIFHWNEQHAQLTKDERTKLTVTRSDPHPNIDKLMVFTHGVSLYELYFYKDSIMHRNSPYGL